MTTPIADGTYYIRNVEYSGFVVNLSGGLPYGAINAWTPTGSTNLQWIVKNIGGNQITLENVTARGYYASVTYFAKAAPTLGTPTPTYWTVKEVSSGVYTLEAEGFLLDLHRGTVLASIFLGPILDTSPAGEAQWTFERVGK